MHLKSWRIDMTREEAKQLLPIIQAFAEGKCVETKTGSGWVNMENMSFVGKPKSYRIKPDPKFRPFKGAEECWNEMQKHQPFGWVKSTLFKDLDLVKRVTTLYVEINRDIIDYKDALDKFTFADDTNFGVKVE